MFYSSLQQLQFDVYLLGTSDKTKMWMKLKMFGALVCGDFGIVSSFQPEKNDNEFPRRVNYLFRWLETLEERSLGS